MSIFNEQTKKNIAKSMNVDSYNILQNASEEQIEELHKIQRKKSVKALDRFRYWWYVVSMKHKERKIYALTDKTNRILAKYSQSVRVKSVVNLTYDIKE